MKEVKRDRDAVKEAIGDPAFYNDQIGVNNVPAKKIAEGRKGRKQKLGGVESH